MTGSTLGGALAGWLSGIGRPVIVTGVTFASLVVNAVLAWGLVLGEWGLPRMGITGAALATVATILLMPLLMIFPPLTQFLLTTHLKAYAPGSNAANSSPPQRPI